MVHKNFSTHTHTHKTTNISFPQIGCVRILFGISSGKTKYALAYSLLHLGTLKSNRREREAEGNSQPKKQEIQGFVGLFVLALGLDSGFLSDNTKQKKPLITKLHPQLRPISTLSQCSCALQNHLNPICSAPLHHDLTSLPTMLHVLRKSIYKSSAVSLSKGNKPCK